MTTPPVANSICSDSQHLMGVLSQHTRELAFIEEFLASYEPIHAALEHNHVHSAQALETWREALAERWECEIKSRRLYKQVYRLVASHYGEEAPEVQMLSRGGAEANSSPNELLLDLRRLEAVLEVQGVPLDTHALRSELVTMREHLERAIARAVACEELQRRAMLERRIAHDAYRRARRQLQQLLRAHFGEAGTADFAFMLEIKS